MNAMQKTTFANATRLRIVLSLRTAGPAVIAPRDGRVARHGFRSSRNGGQMIAQCNGNRVCASGGLA